MDTMLLLSSIALFSLSYAKVCTNLTVPVNIEARQPVFDVPVPRSNLDATRFIQNLTSIRGNYTDEALIHYQTVVGQYNISARVCRPDSDSATNPTVQVLTHGIGFDKSYWDLPFNAYNYSYINMAVDVYGFHTVSIDRFDIGNSSHADPLNIVQAPAEVSALYEITRMLRDGTFPTVGHAFHKIVHVGHSFGSLQSYLLSALHPEAIDGLVLTGFSMNPTWMPQTFAGFNLHLARLNQPLRFGNVSTHSLVRQLQPYIGGSCHPGQPACSVDVLDRLLALAGVDLTSQEIWDEIATTELGDMITNWNNSVPDPPQDHPTGYLTWSDYTANQFAFLYPPYFDPAIGPFAEATKQPVTLGEILSLGGSPPLTTSFSGPVQILTGQQDAIFCGGDCLATGGEHPSIPAAAQMAFPNASAFEAYIHPNTGHGINLHYNSTGAYRVIQEWLLSHGLGSS